MCYAINSVEVRSGRWIGQEVMENIKWLVMRCMACHVCCELSSSLSLARSFVWCLISNWPSMAADDLVVTSSQAGQAGVEGSVPA